MSHKARAARLETGLFGIDGPLKGGLRVGFSVLYGPEQIRTIAHFLAVKTQIPENRGGLGSSTIFIDGGNVFDPYLISEISKKFGLVPERVLSAIYISRAFTCHQLTTLILERLEPALREFSSKLVIISSFPELFYDGEIDQKEAEELALQSVLKIKELVDGYKIIALATASSYHDPPLKKRGVLRRLLKRSDLLIKLREKGKRIEFEIENHRENRRAD